MEVLQKVTGKGQLTCTTKETSGLVCQISSIQGGFMARPICWSRRVVSWQGHLLVEKSIKRMYGS